MDSEPSTRKGRIRRFLGWLTGDRKLQHRGEAEQVEAELREAIEED